MQADSDAKADPKAAAKAALMREPNFRWLMGGGFISALGDQFTMIALPWLILATTGSPLTMGLVIALMSIPRAIFILLGGALVDRYSPKTILMWSKHANTVLLTLLAAMVFTHHMSLPLICVLALALGFASAFSIPSGTSMLPQVVAPALLPMANGIMMGIRQVTMLAGPLLAGLLFILFGDGKDGSANGIGAAFAFDAFSFLASAFTLAKVNTLQAPGKSTHEPVFAAVASGIGMVWKDISLRTCMIYWGLCAFMVGGSMQVALPVLASTRLSGASAMGLLLGVHGAGTLLGMALTGGKPLRVRNFGTTVLLADFMAGILLVPLGLVSASWQAALLLLPVGMIAGFTQVAVFSWIQQRVPRAMLGRTMSIFMFIFVGMAPLSAALTGWLMQFISLTQIYAGAGLFLVLASLFAYLMTPMSKIADGAV